MQRLLKITASLVLIIVVAYFFLIDIAIKALIEREGSKALGARLDIEAVTFHLWPTSLTARNVQAANPRAPMRNMLAADEVSLPLNIGELLEQKLFIEQMQVHGLRFNQPRSDSGALDGLTPAPVDATPTVPRTQQLRTALSRAEAALANPLTAADAQAGGSITAVVLGESFKPLLTQITALLTPPANSAGNNDWQILARRIDIDGQIDLGTEPLRLSGFVENATPQPQQLNVVTRFDFNGIEAQAGKFSTRGTIDFRKLPSASMRFDLSKFPIDTLPLANDADLTVVLSRALADVQGLLSLTGNQIDINVLARFHEAALQVTAAQEPEFQAIANVLKNTAAFDLNLQARGDVQNPQLKLNSSLDKPLAAELLRLQSRTPQSFAPTSNGFNNAQ
jgi:hypothetical protein